MAADDESLELLNFLNLPPGACIDDRLQRWANAFQAWLEERRSKYQRRVGLTSCRAWRELLALTGKAPWQIEVEDVDAYIESVQARGLCAKSAGNLLAPLGSFYAYCQEHGVDALCGPDFNPVRGARRPKIVDYENVRSLSDFEEAALLGAIRRNEGPINKRDYALVLTMLRTGWKAGKVRKLTWEQGNRGASLRLQGRGMGSVAGLMGEVWEAICEYLEAAGRLEGIEDDEYIFAPINSHLTSERLDRAEDWDGGRPLSERQLLRLIKQYAEAAGLKAQAITCHTLRHTAAARRLERGEPLDAVGVCLGRTGKKGTREYLRQLQKSPKGRLLGGNRGIVERRRVPSRRPYRFQRGNHMRLTHGLRAQYLPEFKTLVERGIHLDPFDLEVLRWRIVIKRATILWQHIETVEEGALVLRAMSQAAANLARAIKRRREMRALAKELGLIGGEVISEK